MEYEMEDAEKEDFKDVIQNFQIYGISGEAIEKILDMAEEYDPNLRKELEDMLEADDVDEADAED